VAWIVGARELLVDPSSFLILSSGEKYSMNIDAAKPVETCCVFFSPGFVENVALDLTSPLEPALDQPDRIAPAMPYLTAFHGDQERMLLDRVQNLAPRCEQALAPSGFEEDFLVLAQALLGFYERIRRLAARIPAAKPSTQGELFRRILIGREFLHASASGPVSLAAAARAACLSPFHFHRGFTQAFQKTPHAYLTALRLARARRMIEGGSTVLDACLEAGFASPSAFSRAFRREWGETPSAVRAKLASRTGPPAGIH
jgi:AraC-like DNA-binding protein